MGRPCKVLFVVDLIEIVSIWRPWLRLIWCELREASSVSEAINTIGLKIRLGRLSHTGTEMTALSTCNGLATLNIWQLISLKPLKIRCGYSRYLGKKKVARMDGELCQGHTISNTFNEQYVTSKILYSVLFVPFPFIGYYWKHSLYYYFKWSLLGNIHFKHRDNLVLIFDSIYFKTLT